MPKGQEKELSSVPKPPRAPKLEAQIIASLIELQKLYTSLAEKFNKSLQRLDELHNLFEAAARSFAEHPVEEAGDKHREILALLNRVLEQDRIIAKGITIIEERIGAIPKLPPVKKSEEESPVPATPIDRPLPKF